MSLSIHDHGSPMRCPSPFNLAAHVLARAGDLSEKLALQIVRPQGAERWSYGKLEAAVRATGTGLLQSGLQAGDILVLRLGNTVDFPLAYLGAIAVGVIPVPTSSQLTTAEVDKIIADLSPKAILAGDGIALPSQAACPVIDLVQLRSWRDLAPCDYVMGDPDRLAYMVYTSGTSGRPRAVMQAHRAIWARQMMLRDWYDLQESDRVMHAGAFNWTYTLGTGLMDPWTVGACALIPAEGVTPAQLPLLLKRFDTTIFAAAPGVYRQMLRTPLPALPKLRHGVSAGEALPDSLRELWHQATGRAIHEAYGLSECSTPISGSPQRPAPQGATGYPQAGRRIAILGPDHLPLPRGEVGEIAIHREDPGLFLGYFGQPAETAAKFSGDWFRTGDSALMAADGAISYQGRDDDMMNAGGFRVSPLEVEAVMNQHPALLETAAVEVEVAPDTRVIALFYAGAPQPDADLAAFAAERLARYKQPRIFRALEALPRGANSKLARRALRQAWAAPTGDL